MKSSLKLTHTDRAVMFLKWWEARGKLYKKNTPKLILPGGLQRFRSRSDSVTEVRHAKRIVQREEAGASS